MTAPVLHSPTRCTGACCECFHIGGRSRDELREMAFKAIDHAHEMDDHADAEEARVEPAIVEQKRALAVAAWAVARDIAMVASMVRPVVGDFFDPRSKRIVWLSESAHRFTCVHFVDGNCTAYDERPELCSLYPYGHDCEHGERCTWKEAVPISRMLAERPRVREVYNAVRAPKLGMCDRDMLVPITAGKGLTLRRLAFLDRLTISPAEWAD